ncbi:MULTISPECIES: DUF2939 domain-containing protein [Caulobacter]|jgi:hypothetical protein|uniref:DUF2939 domain-containing protein n=1 Tax=Caulobacter vibrioides OR37 TaxID=1292034 RepID=R0ES64_CAUVI|nr:MULTISPECIES: DUF2939 domain-containing protein [Caulobacter]ENZ83817.1 hypothetical protein OR37_00324 [Caulobacter vibrioides OR37]MBQ1562106.1 DUF2939 domain-containing protein [Caulobacter sp.]
MTHNTRILIGAGVALAFLLLVAAYFASPFLALRNLTSAARAGDRDRLEQAVDFPAVRESLKSQLKAAMLQSFSKDESLRDNPFAAFGQMLVVGLVDKAVDAYATPDAIATMVATSRAPKPNKAEPPDQSDTTPPPTATESKAKSTIETHAAYTDLDHFRVTYHDRKDPDAAEIGLVLERRGVFAWKLTRIDLPANLGKRD